MTSDDRSEIARVSVVESPPDEWEITSTRGTRERPSGLGWEPFAVESAYQKFDFYGRTERPVGDDTATVWWRRRKP